MIPVRSRSDSLTFTAGCSAIGSESNFSRCPLENATNIERFLDTFARLPDGGLLLPPDITTITHRDLVVGLAARHRLPAMYSSRHFVVAGGLMSYGTDQFDMFGQAAGCPCSKFHKAE